MCNKLTSLIQIEILLLILGLYLEILRTVSEKMCLKILLSGVVACCYILYVYCIIECFTFGDWDLLMLSSNLGLDFQRCLKTQKGTEDIQHSICAWFPLKPTELFVDESASIKGMNNSSRAVFGEIVTNKCGISHSSASYISSLQMDITQLMLKKTKEPLK